MSIIIGICIFVVGSSFGAVLMGLLCAGKRDDQCRECQAYRLRVPK
jgi:hypothetical protein